jgi:hypothetical protein
MPPKPAVTRSPFRKEIEDMILEGKSSRFISKWLEERDEHISHTAINGYRNGPFNIKDEAIKEHNENQSKQRKKKGKKKIISTLELCQKFKDEAHGRDLSEITTVEVSRLAIQAGKLEHDVTKDEPTPVIIVKVEDADAEEQRLIEETADNLSRQTEDTESSES